MTAHAPIPVVVGIDVGGPKKGFHAVALRGNELVAKFESSDASQVAHWCSTQQAEAVAVDAPCCWRPSGAPARAAEIEMAREGIFSFSTPTEVVASGHQFYTWMLLGEALYRQLQPRFLLYSGRNSAGPVSLETFPHAVACALAGKVVLAKTKKAVRREVLQRAGIDPTHFVNIDEIDAALCALAAQAFLAGEYRAFGKRESGYLIVPKKALTSPVTDVAPAPDSPNPEDIPYNSTGHSAQYLSLGRALRLAVDAFESDWQAVQAKGYTQPTLSMRDEARMITIVVLAAAVCESAANAILASWYPPETFDSVERDRKTTPRKWRRIAKLLTGSCNLPSGTELELESLFRIRDSIMHAKAQIRGPDGNEVHPGNAQPWEKISRTSVRSFATLPIRLLEVVPDTAPLLIRMVQIGLKTEV